MLKTVKKNIRKFPHKECTFQDCVSKDHDLALNIIVKMSTGKKLNFTANRL